MIYHFIIMLECGHVLADLGDYDVKNILNGCPEVKAAAVDVIKDLHINNAVLIARNPLKGRIAKRWSIHTPDDLAFSAEKPDIPDPTRPNIDSVGLSSNIRFSLWTHGHIFYLDELRDWTRTEVNNLRGLGPKFFGELEDKLKELGIAFKSEDSTAND